MRRKFVWLPTEKNGRDFTLNAVMFPLRHTTHTYTQVADAEDRVAEVQRRAESERRDAKDAASSLKEQLETLRRQQGGSRG